MSARKTVLSLEQALALPYATQRFVQLGWRVIRVETPGDEGQGNVGDPNRYIGEDLGYHDLHSYYIAPNVGKEAITLNLKRPEGRELLQRIIRRLGVDVFTCGTLPGRYEQLGIDYKTLSQVNPDLIWCGISALGPDYPDRAGYDPALQALLGFTYLTGEKDGMPVPCGVPVIDLKAGDEVFAQVLLALVKQNEEQGGRQIQISMAQCAASWLITAIPQLQFSSSESVLERAGNEHRSFIPCNVYPTRDGHVYLAIGNDLQWAKFCSMSGFEHLARPEWKTNHGRMKDKEILYKEIGEMAGNFSTREFVDLCLKQKLAASPVNSIREVADLEFIRGYLVKTRLPSEKEAALSPPAVNTEFLMENDFHLPCAPRLGEHTRQILTEAGLDGTEILKLEQEGII